MPSDISLSHVHFITSVIAQTTNCLQAASADYIFNKLVKEEI